MMTSGPEGHGAQFYDDLPFLAARVGTFFAEGIRRGGAVVAVARPAHLAAIGSALVDLGLDPTVLANAGRLVLLDAEATLAALSTDGDPDRAKFRSLIGDVLGAARAKSKGKVRVYGEMVDVLWGAGRAEAMHELEALWNELAGEQRFELLCGYRMSAFAEGQHVHTFQRVCAAHTHVLPTEQLADVSSGKLVELEQRARALEAELAHRRAVEDRLALLLAVTGDLAAASSREEVARVAIERGIAAVGASYGGIWLLDADRTHLALLAVSELHTGAAARWTRIAATTDIPLGVVVKSGEPMFIESLDDYRSQFPESFERIQSTISRPQLAYAMLPLVANGAVIGAICLTYEDARRIEVSERTFLAILARQCGLAFERLLMHDIERAARVDAEEATRAREEILSVVSHDLRNPLGTIMMGASTLLSALDPSDSKLGRAHGVAQRIHRQSERMARLIDNLVDFAGIQNGQLAIARTAHKPAAIIAQTNELFGPLAAERGLVFEAASEGELPSIECDAQRAVQIFGNLLGNALKVTPRGGLISIGAQPVADDIVFYVRDTGPGIAADELPSLFERFWRSKHPQYKGAGLGLSIARGLVEAHGGRIWAESQPGAGSTFFFSLTQNRN
jgi:signal transduction histidine kinase